MLSFYVQFGTLFPSKKETLKKVIINGHHFRLSDLLAVSYSKETEQITYQLNENYSEGRLSVSPRKSNKDEIFRINKIFERVNH
ncbi:hypothetical protein [Enterococcus gilvus]|uniref:hypothetical protein n=1 Tax=Enterococcus gilvus TaxID=160453 RepID=UPI0028D4624B|nr:hypothetical protein [Enterococcus gilvus]